MPDVSSKSTPVQLCSVADACGCYASSGASDLSVMKALARAVIAAMTFFEFCDDKVLGAETAVQQMEQLCGYLQQVSLAEKQALEEVLQELMQDVKSGKWVLPEQRKTELLAFYTNFMSHCSLDEAEAP